MVEKLNVHNLQFHKGPSFLAIYPQKLAIMKLDQWNALLRDDDALAVVPYVTSFLTVDRLSHSTFKCTFDQMCYKFWEYTLDRHSNGTSKLSDLST